MEKNNKISICISHSQNLGRLSLYYPLLFILCLSLWLLPEKSLQATAGSPNNKPRIQKAKKNQILVAKRRKKRRSRRKPKREVSQPTPVPSQIILILMRQLQVLVLSVGVVE